MGHSRRFPHWRGGVRGAPDFGPWILPHRAGRIRSASSGRLGVWPEKVAWLGRQRALRSYTAEVVAPLKAGLPARAELFQYGILDHARLGSGSYPLYAMRSRVWSPGRPLVLVAGGVHGYGSRPNLPGSRCLTRSTTVWAIASGSSTETM